MSEIGNKPVFNKEANAELTYQAFRHTQDTIRNTATFDAAQAVSLGGSLLSYDADVKLFLGDELTHSRQLSNPDDTLDEEVVALRRVREAALALATNGNFIALKLELTREAELERQIGETTKDEREKESSRELADKLETIVAVIPDTSEIIHFIPPKPVLHKRV